METTSLERLLQEEGANARCFANRIQCTIPSSWIVQGEHRLAYTTQIRLIECCREWHWKRDVLSSLEEQPADEAKMKSLQAAFLQPILTGSTIELAYHLQEIRRRSYSLCFSVCDATGSPEYASFQMVLVFARPLSQRDSSLLEQIMQALRESAHGHEFWEESRESPSISS